MSRKDRAKAKEIKRGRDGNSEKMQSSFHHFMPPSPHLGSCGQILQMAMQLDSQIAFGLRKTTAGSVFVGAVASSRQSSSGRRQREASL